ncbi:hypothetical protein [Streptomyces sp. VNUA24]|uniref:hypothetical protein n=1 Tax=Streptomyces sp. VNUA24 TaxID=3031131 RepID=UPI0023B7AD3B|nr:hypothetical protein [Streptomyces sp. VNUA24]WEH12832.1 hypothetical protein PYR72_03610 [Streptomyces sp. VNUA24]
MRYLFSADANDHVHCSKTSVGKFPSGFRDTRLVVQDSKLALFEGAAAHGVQETDGLLREATGGDGPLPLLYPAGPPRPGDALGRRRGQPFARDGNDQTMTIAFCRMQLLRQSLHPSADGDYSRLPWRLGLLPRTNNAC